MSYGLARPSAIRKALAFACGGFLLLIVLAWPAGVADYFRHLYPTLNLGDINTAFQRYLGKAASTTSIFLATRYALSAQHLLDVAYMWFWGGGWVATVLLAIGGARLLIQCSTHKRWTGQVWLAAAIIASQLYYLFFMIPKIGPTGDFDLFFPTFVVIAFFAGLAFDRLAELQEHHHDQALTSTAALFGNTVMLLMFILRGQIPIRL